MDAQHLHWPPFWKIKGHFNILKFGITETLLVDQIENIFAFNIFTDFAWVRHQRHRGHNKTFPFQS